MIEEPSVSIFFVLWHIIILFRFREAEKKRSVLIFEHEKERAKWNLEKDHLVN
jgi:hypothetical protein